MLELADYEKINMFKDALHRHYLFDSEVHAFRKRVAISLGEIFNYNHVIFGYTNFQGSKELSLNVVMHNITQKFLEKFYDSNILKDKIFSASNDIILLSEISNYNKKLIYKELLTNYNYTDFMLFFLSTNNSYNGYIIIFKDKSQKKFTDKDKEIIGAIKDYISVEYYNYSYFLKLKNANDMLITQTNHYPIGVIILKDVMNFSYANEIAMEYMNELDIANPKYFSVFYNTHILPNIKYDMIGSGKKHIVRYKTFIFSIVTINNASDQYYANFEKLQHNMDSANLIKTDQDITSIIYMFKDEFSSLNKSKDSLEEYSFSKKEKEIVELLLLGNDNKQIAEYLSIAINTVRVHIQTIYKKVHVNNRTELLFKINNTMTIVNHDNKKS